MKLRSMASASEVKRPVSRPIPLRQAAVIALTTKAAKAEFRGRQDLRNRMIARIVNNDPAFTDSRIREIVMAFHGTKVQDELWILSKLTPQEKKTTMLVFDKWRSEFAKTPISWEQKKELRKKLKGPYSPAHLRKRKK